MSKISDGNTFFFDFTGTTLWLANVEFVAAVDASQFNYDGNFASEAYKTAWEKSGVAGEITFSETINGQSGAMKVMSSGSNWYTGHTIYLSAAIIAQAKAQGKTHLTLKITAENEKAYADYVCADGALVKEHPNNDTRCFILKMA